MGNTNSAFSSWDSKERRQPSMHGEMQNGGTQRERERERELGRGQEDAIIALHRPTDRRERRGEGGRDAEMDGFGMRVAAQRPQKEQSDTRLSTSLPPSGKMENGAKEGRQGENKRKRKKCKCVPETNVI